MLDNFIDDNFSSFFNNNNSFSNNNVLDNDLAENKNEVNNECLKKIELENISLKSDIFSLNSEIILLKDEINKTMDLYLRTKAESENIIKRTKRDIENSYKYSLESFFKDFIKFIDSFESVVVNVNNHKSIPLELYDGINMTYKLLIGLCEENNLKTSDVSCKIFDPIFHEAVSVVSSPEYDSDFIVEYLQKGYILNGRVLRTAKVVVNKK